VGAFATVATKGLQMRRILALVALVLAGSIGRAEASTVTFEDIGVAAGGDVVYVSPDPISGGFLFDAQNHSHISNAFWNTDNGSSYLVVDEFGGPDTLTVSPVSGGPFALTSIDISEAHPLAGFYARQVRIAGNVFGGGTVSRTLVLDNNWAPVLANYFETFTFDAGWGNLSSFTLTGSGAPVGGNYYAIDNVVVGSAASVPEPGTLTLLGLGSAYLIRRRRHNR
jgi:hypothetical protein